MSHYYFVIRGRASESEDLGGMSLSDDGEALAFGERVIRDLMREDARQYIGSIISVTEGQRAVGSIAFDAVRDQKT